MQSPGGLRLSTMPVHSVLLETGMDVTAKLLPAFKRGSEENAVAPLCTTVKDHNNSFLQGLPRQATISNGWYVYMYVRLSALYLLRNYRGELSLPLLERDYNLMSSGYRGGVSQKSSLLETFSLRRQLSLH